MTEPGAAPSPLMNINDFAEAIGVTRQTVRNRLRAGTCVPAPIPGTKPAKWRRVDIEALREPSE